MRKLNPGDWLFLAAIACLFCLAGLKLASAVLKIRDIYSPSQSERQAP